MNKRIIILGASGFIGKYIYKNFQSDMIYDVVGFSSKDCNLLSPDQIQEKLLFIEEDDVIIMASAITRLKENTFDSMIKNIQMADNISKFIGGKRVGYFIFLSTVDVYGLVDTTNFIDEKLLPNPNDYYALSKLSSEFILKKMCNKNNIPILILRLSGIYGYGDQGKNTIGKLIESAIKNKEITVYGDGKDKRDFVYVGDVCNIIKNATKHKINTILNVATGKSYSINEIVEIIKLNYPEKFVVKYKAREDYFEERVKDMIYDVSLLTTTFPDLKFKDIKEGISIYINNF